MAPVYGNKSFDDLNAPILSVLMNVFNVEDYLSESIESILNQTFGNFEFIILDDGSTDNSKIIIERYAKIDSRIKFICRENRGIVQSRNELLSIARGRFFCIMDGDDISLEDRFEAQINFLINNPDYNIVSCRMLLIDPEGLPLKIINNIYDHDDIDSANLKTDDFLTLGAYMAITESVNLIGGYRSDIIYAEDRDIFLRLAEIGKIKVLPSVLYKYRQHFKSTCLNRKSEVDRFVRRVISDAHIRRGLSECEFITDGLNCIIEQKRVNHFSIWGWWALKDGNLKVARKYAVKSIFSDPFNQVSWRLLFCSLRGY